MVDPATPAIEAQGLTKRYGDFVAVDALDLRVERRSVAALLGPNGAGKTTMVRMLATLARPDAGRALVAGHDVVREAGTVRSLISRENLVLMARLRGKDRRSARTIVDALIERFDIGEFRDQLIKNVSGGQ